MAYIFDGRSSVTLFAWFSKVPGDVVSHSYVTSCIDDLPSRGLNRGQDKLDRGARPFITLHVLARPQTVTQCDSRGEN